ncbi:bifunctional (p)ppGpp synthetase/guanosine-3',5'-bis(diphosphate) 3'-pyrophosphohydrolase [Candidatus Peregrinibacteria bacterium]|nr:bifunctional (p)ppGpp synthetase/guanosine-3',5'-bis(diphosphate) 3'-pyrophosphohydrolase [Candidatus Peregrinibacteria bacterium]
MPASSTPLAAILKPLHEAKLPVEQERLLAIVSRADNVYKGAMHWTGVTLLEHALGVIKILLPFQPDSDTVAACILQHALEIKTMSPIALQEEFGPRVRAIVSGVYLLSHVSMRNSKSSVEDMRLMLLSVADDIRILLIVLSKRCFALEHIARLPPADRRRVARDVLNLFAPVAARLGIHALKQRLEALAFPVAYPSDAEHIEEQLQQVHDRYGPFLAPASEELKRALGEQGIVASIHGREKQPYSLFRKMTGKSLSHIESLPDLFALRVVVETEAECYLVLGALHRIGRPVTNRFKDYIAFPKPNGYQSLHTTVAKLPGVPEGVFVEVQVRTRSMHRKAEYGVAAHWSYKEGWGAEQATQRTRLQQALASQHSAGIGGRSAPRLVEHIFVLTPKGDVVELPEGATTLDFAFQIHTDVGLTFRAARVNGAIVPLEYELENGDVVEIITQRTPQATAKWLQLLKMASSRSHLKRYLHTTHREENIQRGKEIIVAELKKRRLPALDSGLSLLRFHDGKSLSMSEREDLLMKIGQGTDRAGSLLQRLDLLRPLRTATAAAATGDARPAFVAIGMARTSLVTRLADGRAPGQSSGKYAFAQPSLELWPASKVSAGRQRFQRKDSLVDIDGNVPMPLKFARCCKPDSDIKGLSVGRASRIAGIITRSGDVMIHDAKCKNVQRGNPDRRIGVRWRKAQ